MAVRVFRRTAVPLAAVSMVLALVACHRRGADAEGASSRGLQVEAYDPPIPKAPHKGRLETLTPHPEDSLAAPSAPASGEEPAASSLPAKG